MFKYVVGPDGHGTEVELTPEEEAAFVSSLHTSDIVPPLALVRIAATRLDVAEFDITGFERSEGVAGGWMNNIDWAVVMLAEEQPDTYYDVFPADGVTKYTDRVEIQRTNLTTVNLLIQRVQ
jgi:hypothetical protein